MPISPLDAVTLKSNISGDIGKILSLTLDEAAAINVATGLAIDAIPLPLPPLVSRWWRLPLNLVSVTCMQRQFTRDRYNRWETALVFTTTAITEVIQHTDLSPAGQGGAKTLNYVRYALEFDGVERASSTLNPTGNQTTLIGSFSAELDGGYLSELFGYDAAGTKVLLMRCGVYLDREGKCRDWPYTWRHAGSFAWTHGNPNNDVFRMPKADATPVARPLPPRKSFRPMATAIVASSIARRMLMPGAFEGDHDNHIPCTTKSGIVVCENQQGYQQNGLFEAHSRFPILMGPRNIARLPYPLVGKTRRNGKTLVCGNGYIAEVDETGTAKLHAGHCHKDAVYHNEPPTSVLDPRYIRRGKWHPSIPIEEQKFHTPWGGAWVPRSIELDMTAPLINGEPPHKNYVTADGRLINGPLWLQTDKNGGVWAVQFDGHDEDAEPDIYRFLPAGTFRDGVGMTTHGNSLYVTDRVSQTLEEWDLDTRQKIRNVLSAPAAGVGYMDVYPRLRFTYFPGKTFVDARAFNICYPEGLDKFVDASGDLWLYYASSAAQWISRVNVRTGVVEAGVARPPANMYSRQGVGDYFTTVAVSPIVDGFGPPGTVFYSTFSNYIYGRPMATLPNGAGWQYFNYIFGGGNYSITQCVGGNRLTTFDNDGWIDQFHLFEAGVDTTMQWAKIQAGFDNWRITGQSVKHGPNAVGAGRTPFAFGENADRDVYMRDFLGLQPAL